jgi:hypothetical protein
MDEYVEANTPQVYRRITFSRSTTLLTRFTKYTLTKLHMKCTIFWDITSCSPLKVNWRFGGTYRLHLQGGSKSRTRNRRKCPLCLPPAFTLVSCWAYSANLKMEAICSSETSVYFQKTTQRFVPEIVLFITTAVRTSDSTKLHIFKH